MFKTFSSSSGCRHTRVGPNGGRAQQQNQNSAVLNLISSWGTWNGRNTRKHFGGISESNLQVSAPRSSWNLIFGYVTDLGWSYCIYFLWKNVFEKKCMNKYQSKKTGSKKTFFPLKIVISKISIKKNLRFSKQKFRSFFFTYIITSSKICNILSNDEFPTISGCWDKLIWFRNSSKITFLPGGLGQKIKIT